MTTDKNASQYKEKVAHGTPDFPLGFYEVVPQHPWRGFQHHWHEEIELLFFEEGRGEVKINMESLPVHGEVFFFINSGELHSMSVSGSCRESAVLFHPRMLCFDTYDHSQGQLLQPLLKGELSLPRSLPASHPAYPGVKKEYLEIVDVCRNSAGALSSDASAQLLVKAGLLKILAILSAYHLLGSCAGNGYRIEHLKNVLVYIRSHYQDKIHIQDLAGLVNMNEQYFCRFFKRAIGQPPISYLNEYRIRQAILLLRDTDLTVMDISLNCGFFNFGNFVREFKKSTGTTPLKYRQAARSEEPGPNAEKS